MVEIYVALGVITLTGVVETFSPCIIQYRICNTLFASVWSAYGTFPVYLQGVRRFSLYPECLWRSSVPHACRSLFINGSHVNVTTSGTNVTMTICVNMTNVTVITESARAHSYYSS